MPVVRVSWFEGKDTAAKKAVAAEITESIVKTPALRPNTSTSSSRTWHRPTGRAEALSLERVPRNLEPKPSSTPTAQLVIPMRPVHSSLTAGPSPVPSHL
jgi:Tautomerase enzyme